MEELESPVSPHLINRSWILCWVFLLFDISFALGVIIKNSNYEGMPRSRISTVRPKGEQGKTGYNKKEKSNRRINR